MSRGPLQNFRGLRALVLAPDDDNRRVLRETLERLGLVVVCYDPQGPDETTATLIADAEILLIDTDPLDGSVMPLLAGTGRPLVALIGHETPSRLQRALDLEPAAVLMKPVRPNGVYTSLFFAGNEHRRRQELAGKLQSLERRHGARRFVVKALMALMQRHGIDDEQAFRMLRKESMRRQLTVEELSVRLMAALPGDTPPVARKA